MIQLIATPEKYDGQLVRVIGVGNLVFEGNCTPGLDVKIPTTSAAGYLRPMLMADGQAQYVGMLGENVVAIRSKNENGVWKHSVASFNANNSDSIQYRTKETALATYPVGTEQFLNGGDL